MARGKRCDHDRSERRADGRCRVCRRETLARSRAGGLRVYRVETLLRDDAADRRVSGDHPARALSLDVALGRDLGAVEAEPRRSRTRVSISGGFKTAEGGGSPRAWVVCRCELCASSRVTFDNGQERRQDGERGNPHPVHYLRLSDANPVRRALISGDANRGIHVRPPAREVAA